MVKLARSGSVPGMVSTAVTIAMRSSWQRVSSAQVSCSSLARSPERRTWPFSMVCRSARYADSISSGSGGALLHPRPLRTGRAGFPVARLKQALWRAGPAADSPAAVGVYEVVCGLLAWRAEVHHGGEGLLAEGLPDGGVPLLPLALVVRLVAGVEQQSPAEGAPAVLAAQQVPGRGADRPNTPAAAVTA
jgi:hypothetical protein